MIGGLDEFAQQAHTIISSPRAREAFDVSQESPAIAQQFGDQPFGQSCLLACRLVEAGVRFATVTFGGWDTHRNIFETLKTGRLPQLDEGLSALFNTLAAKGLLESTAVFVTGEFGRTPKINPNAGRDHWPRAMFCLMAGGGIKGGQVVGASDDKGMGPAGDADHARRRRRIVLPRAGDRLPQGISHQHGPPGDDRPRRRRDPATDCLAPCWITG